MIAIGPVIASVGSTIISSILTKRVIMLVVLKLMDYLVASTDTNLDNELWKEIKEAIKSEAGV